MKKFAFACAAIFVVLGLHWATGTPKEPIPEPARKAEKCAFYYYTQIGSKRYLTCSSENPTKSQARAILDAR